ncbi:hypothetical protein, partial [Pseudomonas syringae group genomosp. 3]|uniref:hypothetical protein n=1 Tax=Pseudomonas syringae group genomosp. 3 TaxID=251701 RepID=UPI001E54327C
PPPPTLLAYNPPDRLFPPFLQHHRLCVVNADPAVSHRHVPGHRPGPSNKGSVTMIEKLQLRILE